MRTENWQSNMRGLRLVGEGESGPVLNPYGPCEAYVTLMSVMEHLVRLNALLKSTDTTD